MGNHFVEPFEASNSRLRYDEMLRNDPSLATKPGVVLSTPTDAGSKLVFSELKDAKWLEKPATIRDHRTVFGYTVKARRAFTQQQLINERADDLAKAERWLESRTDLDLATRLEIRKLLGLDVTQKFEYGPLGGRPTIKPVRSSPGCWVTLTPTDQAREREAQPPEWSEEVRRRHGRRGRARALRRE